MNDVIDLLADQLRYGTDSMVSYVLGIFCQRLQHAAFEVTADEPTPFKRGQRYYA